MKKYQILGLLIGSLSLISSPATAEETSTDFSANISLLQLASGTTFQCLGRHVFEFPRTALYSGAQPVILVGTEAQVTRCRNSLARAELGFQREPVKHISFLRYHVDSSERVIQEISAVTKLPRQNLFFISYGPAK